MSSEMLVVVKPFQSEPKVADSSVIRQFVKDLSQIDEKVKDAKENLKEAISSTDEIQAIDDDIKALREQRKEVIKNHAVIQAYLEELEDIIKEKKQLIADAKSDGVPKGEIDLAIKALKKDLDITASVEIYKNIADLVE